MAIKRYSIELTAPDISAYRIGNTGIPYVTSFDSGRPGPHVWVQALTHGNEICGALALDWLFKQQARPVRGKLSLAFANVEAFSRFDPANPDVSRYCDEDFNRVWADDALNSARDSIELRRAREMVKAIDSADYLLDIHSMHDPCRPIMVCGTSVKSVNFAREIGVPGDLLTDTGHPAGLRMIERGGFGDLASPRKAVLIECGQHWETSSELVAKDTLLRFLKVCDVMEPQWIAEQLLRLSLPLPAEQQWIQVTEPVVANTMNFRFEQPWRGLEMIQQAGTVVARDGDHVWRTPYDRCVMVMPSMAHLKPGTTMVRLGQVK
jgi:Succinylglutamate desuccinylase / Aspartoacylase family